MGVNMKMQVILLCLVSLFIFACSGSKVKLDQSAGKDAIDEQITLIEKHIEDPARRDNCIAVVKEWGYTVTKFHEEYQTYVKKIRVLQADYQSTRAQFEAAFNDINPKYEDLLNRLISGRQALVELTTEDEWRLISVRERIHVP